MSVFGEGNGIWQKNMQQRRRRGKEEEEERKEEEKGGERGEGGVASADGS